MIDHLKTASAGLAACLGALAIALPGAASAQDANLIDSVTKADLDLIVADLGHEVTFETGADDEVPGIQLQTEDDWVFVILGNACSSGVCAGIKLYAEYPLSDVVTLENVNALNRSIPAAKIWIDTENGFWRSERYLIIDGGYTIDAIKYEIETFEAVSEFIVEQFEEM